MVKAIKAAQFADQLRDCIAEWTTQDLPGYFFSITQVTLSPDLGKATVWVDCLDKAQEVAIIGKLQKNRPSYQHRLRQRFTRKILPKLNFEVDNTQEMSARFDDLLK